MGNNATNAFGMKVNNRKLLFNIIRKMPVSRAEIARITGLTRAAVTLIVDDLIKDGTLVEYGIGEAEFGRKPVLLDMNIKKNFVIGVCISREGFFISISNINAEPIIMTQGTFTGDLNQQKSLKKIIIELENIIIQSKIPKGKILGIGITTPGPVDVKAGIILNPPNFNGWENINITQEFKNYFDIEAYLENYSSGLALAEKNYGVGKNFSSFMVLDVDEGVGAGIIINDHLYMGVGGFGNEVGHTTIDINGESCDCGNKGCLEMYASIPAILKEHSRNELMDITSWEAIVDGEAVGNQLCRKVLEREAFYLSAGIVNILNVLELEAIILTGDINYKPQKLLELVRKNVETTAMLRGHRKVPILSSSITNNIEIMSATSVIIEKFFVIPSNFV